MSQRFFSSKDVITSFSIFDPMIIPNITSSELLSYGEDSIKTLIDHYTKDLPAEIVQGVEFIKEAIISQDVCAEWKIYRQLISKQPKNNLKSQLKELATNETLITLLSNLHRLATICLSISVGTASVERYFSQMKLMKS